MDNEHLRRRIRIMLVFFIIALAVSGITAIPLHWEIGILHSLLGEGSALGSFFPPLAFWISFVYQGLTSVSREYPFMNYGTDWLAFAHIVIALAFVGPLRDPVKNIWVIEFGMLACALVIPTALIFGALRGIPFFWQMIDCSFGVLGMLPLYAAYTYTRRLMAADHIVVRNPSQLTAA